MTAELFRRHAGRLVLVLAVVLAGGIVLFGQWSHTPKAQVVSWWPYNSARAPVASLRFVGVGPQGTYFAGRVEGLSPVQLAQNLAGVGWHSATILDGSRVVGGVTGHRLAWGVSR